MDTSRPIDLSFRPTSYFWPLGLEKHLLTHMKGAERRAMPQHLIDGGRLDEIPDFLARAKLTDEERIAIGRLHPRFMGGEYLPDQAEGEVEIARIEIASTTFDVTSVYVRRSGRRLRYRVVDEYGGDTLSRRTTRTSLKPLTLGELTDFFLAAWDLLGVLQMNFDDNLEPMLDFFAGRSEFYPDFDRLLRERVREAFPPDDDGTGDADD